MYVIAIPDNKSGREGCYCSLVETEYIDGKAHHKTLLNFGFIPFARVPYLKAVYGKGDPDAIVAREKRSMEEKRSRFSPGKTDKR